MITLNKIIDGICEALNTEFGDAYEIYTEDVQQNLTEPCFTVVLVKPSTKQFLGKRYYRTNLFCIHYFPQSKDNAKSESFDVQERLMDCLEYITVDGDVTRGTQMNGEMNDGVLSFFANYDMFVVKEVEGEPEMETLEHETSVKG
jgi:hypothetical protein